MSSAGAFGLLASAFVEGGLLRAPKLHAIHAHDDVIVLKQQARATGPAHDDEADAALLIGDDDGVAPQELHGRRQSWRRRAETGHDAPWEPQKKSGRERAAFRHADAAGNHDIGLTMRLAPLLVVALAAAASLACSTARPPATPAAAPAPVQGLVRDTGDPHVVAWVSSPWTFSTTSYVIDAPEGLVLIDTQFLPRESLAFVDAAERATGKKAVAAVVLHANPDKFNGTEALKARGIRVITSSQVRALIPQVHEKRLRAFGERYKPDYPLDVPAPEVFGDATMTLPLAGTTVTLHVVGPGCSAAHVVLEWNGNVFAGDLVANGAHSWLEIGETLEWQKRLDEMAALAPRRVHPGRGLSGGPELLTAERAYLDDVIEAVAAARQAGRGTRQAKATILAKHPSLRFPVFLELGLPAEWRRQEEAAETTATAP